MSNHGIFGPATPGSRLAGLHAASGKDFGYLPGFDPVGQKYALTQGPKFDPRTSCYNVNPSTLPLWRTALGRVRAGVGNASLAMIGDSTIFGTGVGGGGGGPFAAPPRYLTALLNSRMVSAVESLGAQSDTLITLGTGWSGSYYGGSGIGSAATSATGNLTISPSAAFDTIVVDYARNPGQGTSTINVDGGASLGNIVTSGTPQAIGSATFTCTAGVHVINIAPPTVGNIQIQRVTTYLSTTKSVVVTNLGLASSTVSTFSGTGGAAWATQNWQTFLAADLTTIELTINDELAHTNLAAYKTGLQTLITRAKVAGDALLVRGIRNAPIESLGYAEAQTEICYRLADENNIGLLDLSHRYGTAAVSTALGGGVHFSPTGYADKAAAYYNAMQV